ncbi:MAG: tetratricopeptide repeat protein [Acidobacteriia bacterium]|nr:tetratricopeptide repeat protein [Terriglobia bacterium]
MKRTISAVILIVIFLPLLLHAQLDKIVIPAGTPEDKALQAISNEPDAQKKLTMYEGFVQEFASNPAAVAYGNWQISQHYQTASDLQKALEYGDKALASSPHNLDILVSQANVAQQMKNNGKVIDYALRGGEAYNSINKEAKPEGMSDQDFALRLEEEKNAAKSSYEFLEAAAFNAIVDEADAKTRMADIERFTPAFPNSRFEDQVASYAMMSLSELKDMSRLVAYGEKALAANPNSLATLTLLSTTYVEDPKPGSLSKAITYAQKTIEVAKADAPDADRSRKLSAGVAHSTLGYAYMKEDKTAAAVPELKAAAALLKEQDEQQYAIALYRLGYAYAKLNKVTEAREVLNEAVKIAGPVQGPAQDLLTKVNAARAKGK